MVDPPLTAATRGPPAVPPSDTSALSKPVTDSLNSTVKLIVVSLVGSSCPEAWLIVTVGEVVSITSSFVELSVPVFPTESVAITDTS